MTVNIVNAVRRKQHKCSLDIVNVGRAVNLLLRYFRHLSNTDSRIHGFTIFTIFTIFTAYPAYPAPALPADCRVIDPELRRSIVELGMVRSIDEPAEGTIAVTVSLTTPGCPIRSHFESAVRSAEITMVPKNTVSLAGDAAASALKLLEALEDHDDVQSVSANLDVDPAEAERLSAA